MKIFVLGDAGYDTYHIGTVRGLSAEAAIPVVNQTQEITLPGMAGNVAANLLRLGADVQYLERVQQNYPTKHRLMTAEGTQLARWDVDDWCRPYEKGDLVGLLEADALVVSDYGKGSISEEVIQILRGTTLPLFVDTKGDPSAWIGSEATLFPNWEEYKRYEEKYNWFPRVVLKRGKDGLALLEFGSVVLQRPALARYVGSVNGAGDTVLAAFVLAFLLGPEYGYPIPEVLDFASAAAAIVVEQPFTQRWTTSEAAIERMANGQQKTQDSQFFGNDLSTPLVSRFGLYPGMELLPTETTGGLRTGDEDGSDPDVQAASAVSAVTAKGRAN